MKLLYIQFDPYVWGTVSDWVMVGVTTLTALFLIKTFREQKRSNEIALNKDRREVMPIFEIDSCDNKYLNIKLTRNVAYEISAIPSRDKVIHFSPRLPELKPEEIIILNLVKRDISESEPTIVLIFKDIDGRHYSQEITGFDFGEVISFPKETPKNPYKFFEWMIKLNFLEK